MGDEAMAEQIKVSSGQVALALGVGGLVGLLVGAAVASMQAEDEQRAAEDRGFRRGWSAHAADPSELYAKSTARHEGYREGLADGRTYERRDRGVELPSRPTGEWGTGAGEPPEEGP